jgi:hypothetical protein
MILLLALITMLAPLISARTVLALPTETIPSSNVMTTTSALSKMLATLMAVAVVILTIPTFALI